MTDEQIISELKLRIDYVSKATLDLISRYKAENERLENQNTSLLKKKCKDINTARKIIKSEAIKDFAERLKEKVKMYNSEGVEGCDLIDDFLAVGETVEIIDRLVKEMTEGVGQ